MWGPALFLVTIVLVTSGGREYASQLVDLLAVRFSLPAWSVLTMVLSAVGSMLLLRKAPEKGQVCWVWREYRGDPGEE